MSIEDENVIADAVEGATHREILHWLNNVAQCDGTNNESKFAAILRGILLRLDKRDDYEQEQRDQNE
jgi:hypothetical protein